MKYLLILTILVISILSILSRDYYEVLGIKKRSTQQEIKKAYKKLSLEKHPDKAGNTEAATKVFQEIAEAYQVLSDKEKREIYDKSGVEGLKNHGQQQGRDPFDLFSFFNGGNRQSDEEKRTPDLEMDLFVTLKDLYLGTSFSMTVKNIQLCPHCSGTGARSDDDIVKCSSCDGKGMKMTTRQIMPGFVQQMQVPCDVCGGTGKRIRAKCPVCKGHKTAPHKKRLTLRVDPGTPGNHKITLENEGDETPGVLAGHLIFVVNTLPHQNFTRAGDDLHIDVTVSLAEALLGMDRTITHLDGRIIPLKKSSITKPSEIFLINEEGMPKYGLSSSRGNLYVHFTIKFPDKLTDDQKKGFASIL